ncbi:AAA family ATPase [Paenibacillus koleovorans]|uniref:AAA family ATPase n=1 Tax=Paenibacillus koleovorans TaxID=121608 RepID=UPI000FDB45DA|nr:AAA family ATPase [Paenibacillus koleovorans]
MVEWRGYRTVEELGGNEEIRLYRLQRMEDGLFVVAKTTCDEYPASAMAAAFRYEYDILRRLDGKGAAKPYSLEFLGDRPLLLLEDNGGCTLEKLLREREQGQERGQTDTSASVAEADGSELHAQLELAAALAETLRDMHREQITHQEMVPHLILVNRDKRQVQWLDLRRCSTASGRSPLVRQPHAASGLPYISPEHTGRSDREPDYRSDFYSLGVLLYEWFTGCLPFDQTDEFELVYRHLAVQPEPAYVRAPFLPEIVSAIISKCMEKMPDDRYASAFGIAADLQVCLDRCATESGEIEGFQLATQDVPERWLFPAQLYGRETPRQRMREAWQRAAEGAIEVVLVSGAGGIGKSAFARDALLQPEADGSGNGTATGSPSIASIASITASFTAVAKFDPNPQALPYDVWVQALEAFIDQLLMESEIQSEVWKLRMLDALDGYGRLLTELVPRLELLIGEQPSVQTLQPLEAQHRFHLVLGRFLQLFAGRAGQPLILLFDDLQWADEASLQFLVQFVSDQESRHLLIACTYREEEVGPAHPVGRLVRELTERRISTSTLPLEPLSLQEVQRLLQDAMRVGAQQVEPLAELLLHKTAGNPLFLKQVLQELVERGHIAFQDRERHWQWNLQAIAERDIPDSVAAYLSSRMRLLPAQTVHVLGRAALLGSRFELSALSALTGLSGEPLLESIDVAESERLLQQAGSGAPLYRFQHDRIRQAASALIREEERPGLHLQAGRLLLESLQAGGEASVFEAVNHLNEAASCGIGSREERLEWAKLNMQAGARAKQATAYETALGYFRQATALLDESYWESRYALMFEAYKERAQAEFLCMQFETANDSFRQLLQHSRTALDQAHVYSLMVQLEASRDNYERVMALSAKVLQLVGVRYRIQPNSFALTRQWLKLAWRLRGLRIESLLELPPMTDESRKLAMAVLVSICNVTFTPDKISWAAATFTLLEMTLDYGLTPESSVGFAGYALFVYYRFHQDREAFEWGNIARQVSEPYPALHVKVLSAISLCYDSWRKYEPDYLSKFAAAAGKVGLESGDLWQGNQSVLISCSLLFAFGHPLGDIYDRVVRHTTEFQRGENGIQWQEASVFAQMLTRLTGRRSPDDRFNVNELDRLRGIERVHEDYLSLLKELCHIANYVAFYIHGRYEEALVELNLATAILEARKNDLHEHTGHYMFETLTRAELFERGTDLDKKETLALLRSRLKQLKRYAARCPENYQHKYWLVQAEQARLTGRDREADELYERAVEDAREHGHIHNMGMAAERYAKYLLKKGRPQAAKVYMTEAYEAFRQWGAALKATELAAQYGYLLQTRPEPGGWDRLDVQSVVMSAQALSGEMEMSRLLHMLMRIMLRNAGAEAGALLFEQDGSWIVEAHGTAESLAIESIPLERAGQLLPTAVIGYAARTQEEVVLHDAAEEGMFSRNAYIREFRPRSVLCLPIRHQDKLICLLYMENRLSAGLFTEERLAVLKLLCSQCAISIDNARLYSGMQQLKISLERQVEERTRSLELSMRETAAAIADMSVYEERNRIAQEIHDVVGHTLTSTILQVEAGKRLLHKDKEGAVRRLEGAQNLVRHGLNEIRRSVRMLKEGKTFELDQALRQLIRDTEEHTGVAVEASFPDELPELSTAQSKTIYHALQEGLTNGIRHGGSTKFRFRLELEAESIRFRLEDNGRGAEQFEMGFGLKSMQERVEQLNGQLQIGLQSGQGGVLQLVIPNRTASGEEHGDG